MRTTSHPNRIIGLLALTAILVSLVAGNTIAGSSAVSSSAALNQPGAPAVTNTPTANPGSQPNIVFILTDDLDYYEYSLFPQVNQLLTQQGTTFNNFFVSDSLCCPSRSSILRGQFIHNHGVLNNGGPSGGFAHFHALGNEDSTVATWLQAAGYHTGLLGKYLNGYPDTVPQTYVPPGWDEWASPSAGNPYYEYNYTMTERTTMTNTTLVGYGSQPQDYMVDVLSAKAASFIQRAPSNQPLFLYVAPYVPHQPATPAPRYANAFPGVQAPRVPSFNEADVSDKPAWLQSHPLLTPAEISAIDALYRKRLQTMLGIDDLVANVVNTLQATGRLNNTYIVFTSDNGFHLGQHRLNPGKQTAYEEDIHVPLIVRGPGVPAARVDSHIALNIDFAPTFAELGGATAASFVDGRSLVPLLHNQPVPSWRTATIIEHYANSELGLPAQATDPDNDSGLYTAGAPGAPYSTPPPGQDPITPYFALRTASGYTYVEYNTGEREFYDLNTDPYELQNAITTTDPSLISSLANTLAALSTCAGASCRIADLGPATPTPNPNATNTPTFTPTPTPSATLTDCPNPFTDISGDIFYGAIHYLYCRGVVNGTDATHFSPTATSTRTQFAKVVVLGFGIADYTPPAPDFTDVPPDYFAYAYIEAAFHAGILSGFDPASCTAHNAQFPCYLPNLAITRGQLTKLVVSAAHYLLITPTGGPSFTDVPPSNVFYAFIETAHAHGVVNGYPDGSFHPNDNIQRDQMCQIVYKGITTP